MTVAAAESVQLLAVAAGVLGGVAALVATALRASPPVPGGDADAIRIDALLPQTQCGQCGYPGCRPYADAIAQGDAINKCPPGGRVTIAALADLLGRPVLALDASHGVEAEQRSVAVIREPECIGCTKCILACPVDAIVGATGHMHTVIVSECTGCDLCVAPCPVDCIDMVPADIGARELA